MIEYQIWTLQILAQGIERTREADNKRCRRSVESRCKPDRHIVIRSVAQRLGLDGQRNGERHSCRQPHRQHAACYQVYGMDLQTDLEWSSSFSSMSHREFKLTRQPQQSDLRILTSKGVFFLTSVSVFVISRDISVSYWYTRKQSQISIHPTFWHSLR